LIRSSRRKRLKEDGSKTQRETTIRECKLPFDRIAQNETQKTREREREREMAREVRKRIRRSQQVYCDSIPAQKYVTQSRTDINVKEKSKAEKVSMLWTVCFRSNQGYITVDDTEKGMRKGNTTHEMGECKWKSV
jgi:hypothetical protein